MAQLEIKPTPLMLQRVFIVLVAAVILALTEAWLLAGGTGSFFEPKVNLTTSMPDAGGLLPDAEVRMNGIRIGTVSAVELVGSDVRRPVRVRMRILSHFVRDIPDDSRTAVSADTMVGPKFVEIKAGKSLIAVRANGLLESEPIKEAVNRANQLLTLQNELTQVNQILTDLSSPLSPTGQLFMSEQMYDTVLRDVRDFDRGLNSYLTPKSDLGQALYTLKMYDEIEDFIKKLDNALAQIQNGQGALGHAYASDEQYNEIVRDLTDLRSSLADANAGKGKTGALLMDESSYRQITHDLSGIDRTLASLNAGEGRAGQLLANQQLYDSLTGSLRKLERLLRDLRENPRKYLRIKPFEKNPYTAKNSYRASAKPSAQANSRSSSFLPEAARR